MRLTPVCGVAKKVLGECAANGAILASTKPVVHEVELLSLSGTITVTHAQLVEGGKHGCNEVLVVIDRLPDVAEDRSHHRGH